MQEKRQVCILANIAETDLICTHLDASLNLVSLCVCLSPRPLHIAARSGMVRVVQELVRRGADLNARDRNGKTLYSACCECT